MLENMLSKREPTDLPTLFCSICLLLMTRNNFRLVDIRYIDYFVDLGEPLEQVWNALATLLHVLAADHNPLTLGWNVEAYETLVGGSHPSVA